MTLTWGEKRREGQVVIRAVCPRSEKSGYSLGPAISDHTWQVARKQRLAFLTGPLCCSMLSHEWSKPVMFLLSCKGVNSCTG